MPKFENQDQEPVFEEDEHELEEELYGTVHDLFDEPVLSVTDLLFEELEEFLR